MIRVRLHELGVLPRKPGVHESGEPPCLPQQLVRLILTDLIALVADHVPPPSAEVEVANERNGIPSERDPGRLERDLMMPNA